ncbi:cAMP-specific 3' 5'-cyclic phosphodiesterase isoform I isoform X13 [Sarcoptes scabiei]|nr:cAMP-specific 3' 5'-cyclic phosphodiesterase isoform I isoform X13 [Sarcoptes scabiei]
MDSDESQLNRDCDLFIQLTGVTEDQAKFFLESAGYNFELAVQQFYENREDLEDRSDFDSSKAVTAEVSPSMVYSDDESDSPHESVSKNVGKQDQPRGTQSNFATLSSLKNEDRDSKGQTFYVGGSEHSGQQVLGPEKRDSNRIVQDMFDQAKEHAIDEAELKSKNSSKAKPTTFFGLGSTLGSSIESSNKVFVPNSTDIDEQNHKITLNLWRNGFSIDDGPLRSYEDPADAEFLEAIRCGKIPKEFSKQSKSEVHLKMKDCRTQDYQPPPKKMFSGEGQRLGAPTPNESVLNKSSQPATTDSVSKETAEAEAVRFLQLDTNRPQTRVQIRLIDGSRLVAQINTDRTISDLRQYICLARPDYNFLLFEMMTTFPNKVIEDESTSIEKSGLANSSVVLRIKK